MVYLILFSVPALSLLWWFWADRCLRGWKLHGMWRVLLGLGTLWLLAGYLWLVLHRAGQIPMPEPVAQSAAVLVWGLVALPFLALPIMVFSLLWKGGVLLFRRLRKSEHSPDAAPSTQRRRFLKGAAITLPLWLTGGATLFSLPQLRNFRVRDIEVPVSGLPQALEGLVIAHVTDVHVGRFTKGEILQELAEETNKLEADLVLLTGDLIDNSLEDLPEALEMVRAIDPRHGLFMCEGNHDLFQGREAFAQGVAAGGVSLLRNESAVVEVRGAAIEIMGCVWQRDLKITRQDIVTLMKQRQPEAFPILLAHHPHAFDTAADLGIPLTLAGHTHGGQLMLTPDIGPGPMMYRYWSGLYRKLGASLVVGNGAGNWFPLRTQAPAEIVKITLRGVVG